MQSGETLGLGFNRMRFFGPAGLILLALAAAGCVPSRPGPSGRTPERSPPVVVSIPVPTVIAKPVRPAPAPLETAIDGLWRNFQGLTGVAVRAVDEGWTVERGGRRRLPQQSVSKLWVAIAVLDQRDQGGLKLDDPVLVRSEDLTLFHQPIAYLVKGEGFRTTVGGLLERALIHSDNTANDRLMSHIGGPAAVRRMIADKRLGDIRFGPGERLLQSKTAGLVWNPAFAIGNAFEIARSRLDPAARAAALDAYVADPPDGAAPLSIADSIARLARGELLSETSTRYLLDTMGRSVTGRARLRAALPAGWQIAHKTGTGQDLGTRNAGFNDVGLLTAPDGRRYAIAVMLGDTRRPVRERQQLIQGVAAAVAAYGAAGVGGAAN